MYTDLSDTIFLGLGSNVGDRKTQLESAVDRLREGGFNMHRLSGRYQTPPWGMTNQEPFLNQVIAGHFDGTPMELLALIQSVEAAAGRKRTVHWGPRTLDIDILVFGSVWLKGQRLTVPHPYIAERAFVLVPFAEIAPELVVPGLGRSIAHLLEDIPEEDILPILKIDD